MSKELKPRPFCGGEADDIASNRLMMLTPEGWKPAEFIKFQPCKWYLRPLAWLIHKFIKD